MKESGYLLFSNGEKSPLPAGSAKLTAQDVEAALNGHRPNDVVEAFIPEGITTVGEYCFDCYEHLRRVTFHPGVEEIEEGAFDGCCDLFHAIGLQPSTHVEPEGNQAMLGAIGFFF